MFGVIGECLEGFSGRDSRNEGDMAHRHGFRKRNEAKFKTDKGFKVPLRCRDSCLGLFGGFCVHGIDEMLSLGGVEDP